MRAIENAVEVAYGHVPRHDLAQVEAGDVRLHRDDGGLGRFVRPEAVSLLDAPGGSGDDSQVQAILAQIVGVPRRVARQ